MDDALTAAANSTRPTLNPALREFWLTGEVGGQPVRVRVLYGGRSSSKTWDAAGFAVFLASNYKVKYLCTRQFQNKIEESVYAVLITQIDRFGMRDQFRILNNKIIHKTTGSEFVFYGLWRNIDEIKSLEGVDICWIEEAHNLLEDQWRMLRDTIRKNGSQFWIVFNPRLATDFVYRRFVTEPPPGTLVRKINYDENPFLPETMRQTIEDVRAEDEDEYRHVFLGEPLADDEQAVIKRSWVQAAIDAHEKLGIEPTGERRIGFDPADEGDPNAVARRHGILLEAVEEWKAGEHEMHRSSAYVWNIASAHGYMVAYDAPGVGAHCGSHFEELNEDRAIEFQVEYQKFHPGAGVIAPDAEYEHGVLNKDHFYNLKAQAWVALADRFRATFAAVNGAEYDPEELISISSSTPHLEKLIDELTAPRRDYNLNGKFMVEPKKKLLERGIPSPNLADATVIAYAPIEQGVVNVFRKRKHR